MKKGQGEKSPDVAAGHGAWASEALERLRQLEMRRVRVAEVVEAKKAELKDAKDELEAVEMAIHKGLGNPNQAELGFPRNGDG